jgi:hypothetical protein
VRSAIPIMLIDIDDAVSAQAIGKDIGAGLVIYKGKTIGSSWDNIRSFPLQNYSDVKLLPKVFDDTETIGYRADLTPKQRYRRKAKNKQQKLSRKKNR